MSKPPTSQAGPATRRRWLQAALAGLSAVILPPPARADVSARRIPNRLFVTVWTRAPAPLPPGATLEVALYEGNLADAPRKDAARRVLGLGRRRLPVSLSLRLDRATVAALYGPAVTASIRDAAGTLLYIADTHHAYEGGRAIRVEVVPVRR